MNVRPDLATVRAVDDCLAGVTLLPPELARGIILNDVSEISGLETSPLTASLGRVAATDILSEVALPRFDNSAVDGFALHADDLLKQLPLTLKIVGKAAAGHAMAHTLQAGTTARVLTGAQIPEGASAIVRKYFADDPEPLHEVLKDAQRTLLHLRKFRETERPTIH